MITRRIPLLGCLVLITLSLGCGLQQADQGPAPKMQGEIQLVQAPAEPVVQPATEVAADLSLFDTLADIASKEALPEVPDDIPPVRDLPPREGDPDFGFPPQQVDPDRFEGEEFGAAGLENERIIRFFNSADWARIKRQARQNIRLANRQPRVRDCSTMNVVLIVIDDLGYGDLGVYGQTMIKTPNIDQLARTGVRFTNYYAGSSLGVPSHCSLMTGLHTGHCRLRGNSENAVLPESDLTLAEMMMSAGFDTAMYGSWKLGDEKTEGTPTGQGFQETYADLNLEHAKNFYPNYLWRNDQRQPIPGNQNNAREHYALDLVTDEAVDYVDRDRNGHRPFFMMVSLAPPRGNLDEVPSLAPYENEDWPEAQKQYAAMISRVDESVGRIVNALYQRNMKENTVVVLTSDNGPRTDGVNPDFFASNGPLNGTKGTLQDGGIRVPMIIWGPSDVIRGAGSVNHHLWWAPDVMPTLADLVSAWRKPQRIDGVSQIKVVRGQVGEEHPPLYWELHEDGFVQAIRMGDWKGIRMGPREPIQLFNLKDDIGEETDLAQSKPEVIRQMAQMMDEEHFESPQWPVKFDEPPARAAQ